MIAETIMNKIPNELLNEIEAYIKCKLDEFLKAANLPDKNKVKIAESKKLFLPTLEDRKKEFSNLGEISILVNIRQLKAICTCGLEELKLNRRELLSGNRKNNLIEWWLHEIDKRVEEFLEMNSFNLHLIPENYCISPPENLKEIEDNLSILMDILTNKNEEIQQITTELKNKIYKRIDSFLIDSKAVLSAQFGIDIRNCSDISLLNKLFEQLITSKNANSNSSAEPSENSEKNLKNSKEQEDEKDEEMNKEGKEMKNELEIFRDKMNQNVDIDWIEYTIKDIEYLNEMKKLDDPEYWKENKNQHIVPVSGLVLSIFVRFENEHKTVLELWGDSSMALIASPAPGTSSENGPSNTKNPSGDATSSQGHNIQLQDKSINAIYAIDYLQNSLLENQFKQADEFIDKLLKNLPKNFLLFLNKKHPKIGESLLHTASRLYQYKFILKLITKIEGIDINLPDQNGNRILHFSSLHNPSDQLRLFKKLIKRGAKVNVNNNRGESPLHLASSQASLKVVKLLIESKANIHSTCKNNLETSLHYAVRNSSTDIVHLLVLSNADPAQSSSTGETPLNIAINSNNTAMINALKNTFQISNASR